MINILITSKKLISRNHSHYRNGKLKEETRYFINELLLEMGLQIKDQLFTPTNGPYVLHITIGIPKKMMINKNGTIKKRRFDLDNYVKIPIDCLMKTLDIDDAQLLKIQAGKFPIEGQEFRLQMNLTRYIW